MATAKDGTLTGILIGFLGIIPKVISMIGEIYLALYEIVLNTDRHQPLTDRPTTQLVNHTLGWLALTAWVWLPSWWPPLRRSVVSGFDSLIYAGVYLFKRRKAGQRAPSPDEIQQVNLETEIEAELQETERLKARLREKQKERERDHHI